MLLGDSHTDLYTDSQSEKSQATPSSSSLGQSPRARCLTADRALHVSSMEPLLVETLTRLQYEGRYRIQVGFNELMLEEGPRVEEIYVTLERAFYAVAASDICSAFESIFGPFPGVVRSPDETYHVPLDRLSPAIFQLESGFRLFGLSRGDGEGVTVHVENGQDGEESGENSRDVKREEGGGDKGDGGGSGRGRRGPPGSGGDGGGGGGSDGDIQTNHRGGRRMLNIPGFGSTLTLKGPDGCHEVNAICGLEIIVSRTNNDSTLNKLIVVIT